MKHKIKILQRYISRIIDGTKTFEIRKNDRDYQVGDVIEFDIIRDDTDFLIPAVIPSYWITYIHFGLGLQDGYVVLGIQKIIKGNVDNGENV